VPLLLGGGGVSALVQRSANANAKRQVWKPQLSDFTIDEFSKLASRGFFSTASAALFKEPSYEVQSKIIADGPILSFE